MYEDEKVGAEGGWRDEKREQGRGRKYAGDREKGKERWRKRRRTRRNTGRVSE